MTATLRVCRHWGFSFPPHWHNRQLCSGSQDASSSGIFQQYSRLVSEGRIQADPTQLAAVQALQLLQDGLIHRSHARLVNPKQQLLQYGLIHRSNARAVNPQQAQQTTPCADQGRADAVAEISDASSSGMPHVQGAYLWGPVGSGKTMLMDMFLKTLPAANISHPMAYFPATRGPATSSSNGAAGTHGLCQLAAQRLHFHSFMLNVHQQLHQLQQSLPKAVGRSRAGLLVYRRAPPPEDPIVTVARGAAAATDLLCLDELHVTDVADAMLLSRLFGELLARGCSVVITSNRPARDLYKGGLSRRYFEPFIHLVDDRLLQLRVAGGQDYRTASRGAAAAPQQGGLCPDSTGLWLVGRNSTTQLKQHWQRLAQQAAGTECLTAAAAAAAGPASIQLPFRRNLWVPQAILHQQQQQRQAVQQPHPQLQLLGAYFTFKQLCGKDGSRQSLAAAGALSANDYMALVQSCSQLFVEGLPQLQPSQRDEARRLVTLVDLLYEVHTLTPGAVKLCVSSPVPPHEVFLPLLGAAALQGVNPNLGRSGGKLDVKALVQEARVRQPTGAAGLGSAEAGEDATVGGRPAQPSNNGRHTGTVQAGSSAGQAGGAPLASGGAAPAAQRLPQPPALLAEEVLMYHRASSRLNELCAVAPGP